MQGQVPVDELRSWIASLDPASVRQIEAAVAAEARGVRWVPNPGPQTDAYFSKADELLYGGEAGGGKSDLILGLAFNEHNNSLIMRREGTQLGDLLKRTVELNGSARGYNGSSPQKLVLDGGRQLDFGSAKNLGDELAWKGRAHDLLALDEGVDFEENQVRTLKTWLRTTASGQRTRLIIATNPPVGITGQWIIDYFAPWLDPHFPNPAKPGELRWVVMGPNGEDVWVDGPEPVEIQGHLLRPKSRTFIPSSVNDNPFLASRADYRANLDSLPEPYRSAYRDGNFMVARKDSYNQVIPTAWVREAMARWSPQHDPNIPMCAMGVDPGGGGTDERVIASRFDGWYAPLIRIPGDGSPAGRNVAGEVIANRFNNALVIVDLGGGWGSETYAHLIANEVETVGYMGVESTNERTKDRRIGFTNVRSAAYWGFREALDPDQPGGSPIALPNDPKLMSDLTAPTYEIGPRGIAIETKESVVAKLGRSPDGGDAVVMAWTGGAKAATQLGGWAETGLRRRARPKVVMGSRGLPSTAPRRQ